MIEITCWPRIPMVRAEGHAGSAPRGQDLVCAAVTALLLTLRENGTGYLQSGRAEIRGFRSQIPVFLGICRGFSLLAQAYPRHIRFSVAGDREKPLSHDRLHSDEIRKEGSKWKTRKRSL